MTKLEMVKEMINGVNYAVVMKELYKIVANHQRKELKKFIIII